MKVSFKNVQNYSSNVKKFQQGGAMPAPEVEEEMPVEEGAPVEQGGGSPEEMLMQVAQMAAQALQTQDANLAFQTCEAVVQLIQMLQGGGAAPEEAPENSEPVYRRGGTLVRRIKK